MNKHIAEKLIEGSLLEKLVDKEYFVLFASFLFYFDLYSLVTKNNGVMGFSIDFGKEMPIGDILVSIGLFSLLISIILPALFWWCNNLIWSLIEYFKKENSMTISDKDIAWLEKSISGKNLMAWSIKNSNPTAMAAAKEVINELNKIQKNRANHFSLAFFIFLNYYFGIGGLISSLKIALPSGFQCYFPLLPIVCIIIPLYLAFSGPSIRSGYINLPGLKIND